MLTRTLIKERTDALLSQKLNTEYYGQDVKFIVPQMNGTKKYYDIKALINRIDDEYLKNNTAFNSDSRRVKVFMDDIEALRLAGNQLPLNNFKKIKATFIIDSMEYMIEAESLEGNRRILTFFCNRLT